MPSTPETRALARRVLNLERQTLIRRHPSLANASIEDGALRAVDVDGNETMVIGKQYDGTNTTTVVTGPPPPAPATPGVTPALGGLLIYWDGSFADTLVAPMDFTRVTIHAYPVADFAAFNPLDQTRIIGTFTSATGGEILVGLPYGEYVVVLVAWSEAGKFSEPSGAALGSPARVAVGDLGEDTAAELAKIEEAITAADAAGSDAAAALQASQDADAAASAAQQAAVAAQTAADAAASPEDLAALQAVADDAAADAAAAAQTAATAAQAAQAAHDAAVAAANAADAAGALAQSAMDSADGKNSIIRATYPPTNEPNAAGDLWWYRSADDGRILGLYTGAGGTSWVNTKITNEIVGNLDAGKITFGTMSGERIEVGSLVIGQVGGLSTTLAEKATLNQAQIIADAAEQAAIDAAAATTAAAKQAALEAAATDAQAKADAAKSAAITAAATDATNKAGTAQTNAISAAATTAQQKADAAKQAAIDAAAVTAQSKADAAKSAAISAAATDASNKAGTAQTNAISAAATAAETQFGTARDRVAGWTATGKTTINGGMIETDSINSISIRTQELWTDILRAGYLQAGFALLGKLQVGQATFDPADGLVIPQPDGGAIRLPVNGIDPAQITAHLIAKSLNVEDALTISGNGEIQGILDIANGIVAPKSPPSISATWLSLLTALGNGSDDNGDVYIGLSEYNTNQWAVAVNFFGAGIRILNKDNGSVAAIPDPTNGKTWTEDFYPKAYCYGGGAHYIIGTDNKRNADTFLYRIDGATWNKTAEYRFGTITAFGARPALAWDPIAGQPCLVWSDATRQVNFRRYNPTTLAIISTEALITAANISYRLNVGAMSITNNPTGLSGAQILIAPREAPGTIMSFWLSTLARTSANDFARASGTSVVGMSWDARDSHYKTLDSTGRLWTYSNSLGVKNVTGQYTWYDGDVSSGSVAHETQPSPPTTYPLPSRTFIRVETPLPPDILVTDPTRRDKADRIGIYLSTSTGTLPRHQIYLARGTRIFTTEDVNNNNPPAPMTAASFADAGAAAGRVRSAARRANGLPLFEALGDGSGRFDGLIPPGSIMMWAGATPPPGWALCNGAEMSTTANPELFAQVGYSFGGAGTIFYLPNFNNRLPRGAGSLARGASGGADSITLSIAQLPSHNHDMGHNHPIARQATTGSGTGLARGGSTADSITTGAASRTDTGNTGSGAAVPVTNPYLAINFIIKI